MRRVLGVLLVSALLVGIVIQETHGKVERLPAALQPFARSVQAAVAPAASRMEAALAPLRKLLPRSAPAPTPKNPAPRASPKLEPVIITYEEAEDLLDQLRTIPAGQPVSLQQVPPKERKINPVNICQQPPDVQKAYFENFYREQQQLREAIQAELDRINQKKSPSAQ